MNSYPFLRQAQTVAVNAAKKASRIILSYLGKALTVDEKKKHDFVTAADREAEEVLIRTLRHTYPEHDILAEESGEHTSRSSFRWIIDPLDGTTNFIHGFPFFCVSIALEIEGNLVMGIVYDPNRNELFSAIRGHGAFLNRARIHVSDCTDPSRALLATGFPYRDYTHAEPYMRLFKHYMTHTAGIRRPGSAALDLCYLACRRIDGFWELYLKPWDVAAGAVIILEAGGILSDFSGGSDYIFGGNIIGSNPYLHSWMAQAAQKCFEGYLPIKIPSIS